MRKPFTHVDGHSTEYPESVRLGNKMTYAHGYPSPPELRHAVPREEQRLLPPASNSNQTRLPSISQLLNDTTPTALPHAEAQTQSQYNLTDSPPKYRYGGGSRSVPRRLPEPTMAEPSPLSPRTPGGATFQDRQWQLDHHDPGVSKEQQINSDKGKLSPRYDPVQEGRRQTWAPEQFAPACQRPSYEQTQHSHRPSVPSLESLRLNSAADIYPCAEPPYHQHASPYGSSFPQPEVRFSRDTYGTEAYPPSYPGHQHSRSTEYARHAYQPNYQNHAHFPGHNNGPMYYAVPEHAPRHMAGRAVNDVPKKRPKLPPAFKIETRKWIDQHIWHPYPSKEFQQELAVRHGLEQKQVDFHFVNERRRYVVTQLERERALGNHAPPDLEARNQASPTVNASRSPDERYQRRYSGRMGRRGSRFSHGSNGSTSTSASGGAI